jgi:hypothetical protein
MDLHLVVFHTRLRHPGTVQGRGRLLSVAIPHLYILGTEFFCFVFCRGYCENVYPFPCHGPSWAGFLADQSARCGCCTVPGLARSAVRPSYRVGQAAAADAGVRGPGPPPQQQQQRRGLDPLRRLPHLHALQPPTARPHEDPGAAAVAQDSHAVASDALKAYRFVAERAVATGAPGPAGVRIPVPHHPWVGLPKPDGINFLVQSIFFACPVATPARCMRRESTRV